MVTRTGLFSDRSIGPLGSAELVDLSQEFFDAAANLLALGAQRFHFRRKRFLLLAQASHELHRLMDPLLQAAEGIVVLVGSLHAGHAPALTFSVNSRKPA